MSPIILAAILAATPAAPSATTAGPGCVDAPVRQTGDDGSAQGRTLAEMARAYLMRAVQRQAGGCDLAEVRFAYGAWKNLSLGVAPSVARPADKAPSVAPASPPR